MTRRAFVSSKTYQTLKFAALAPDFSQALVHDLGAFGVGGALPVGLPASPSLGGPACLHPPVPEPLREILAAGEALLDQAWDVPFVVLDEATRGFRGCWDEAAPKVSQADRQLSGAGLRALGLLVELTTVMEARCAYAGNAAGAWLYGMQRLSLGQVKARRAGEVEALRSRLAQDLASRPF
jgi:hypothetical protein